MRAALHRLFKLKEPELKMLDIVRKSVRGVRHIIEAGAHNGGDSIRLAKAFPGATIHAFECLPANYRALVKSATGHGNIRTYDKALAPKSGTLSLHVSSGASDASSSLLAPAEHTAIHPEILFHEQIDVQGITVDEWLALNSNITLDFAWLDLQGAEQAVLEASPKALDQLRAIYTEVSFRQMYAGAPLHQEFNKFLEKAGFELVLEDRRWEDMGNALYIKKYNPEMKFDLAKH